MEISNTYCKNCGTDWANAHGRETNDKPFVPCLPGQQHRWELVSENTHTVTYVRDCMVTESNNFDGIRLRFNDARIIRLLHGGMGLATESAELVDALKKHLFYGKPLDRTNLVEEMGDLFWYCAILADALDVSFQEVMDKNIAKLKARYGDKFTSHAALNRNLDKERTTLE